MLIKTLLEEEFLRALEAKFDVVYAPARADCEAQIATVGDTFDAVVTVGSIGVAISDLNRLPRLKIM